MKRPDFAAIAERARVAEAMAASGAGPDWSVDKEELIAELFYQGDIADAAHIAGLCPPAALEVVAWVEGLEKAARALVEALPRCDDLDNERCRCTRPATKAYGRGTTRYCDEHAPIDCPDYPRAAVLRELLAVLSGAASPCVTPTGRTDCHGKYIEDVAGQMSCAFCKRPL